MIERDRDADGSSGNGLEDRLYVQQDANFNVTAIINSSGAVVERYIYDPYGATSFLSSGWTGPADAYNWRVLHQGGRLDSVTGLFNYRNRDLHPTLGRWIQVDPLGFGAGDTNLYRDVGNQPTNATDPSGLVFSILFDPIRITENFYHTMQNGYGLVVAGVDPWSAGYVAVANNVPILGSIIAGVELYDGVSLQGQDLGRPLDFLIGPGE